MTTLSTLLIMVLFKEMIWTKNPVKFSVHLLFLSVAYMFCMSWQTGNSWFPMIFFLLFTGGILVMFLILSSIMPNEMILKNYFKKLNIIFLSTIFIFLNGQPLQESSFLEKSKGLKMMLTESMSIAILIFLILLYFASMSMLIFNLESPLRSQNCHSKVIL